MRAKPISLPRLCPRCKVRPRHVSPSRIETYCSECGTAYCKEVARGTHRVVRLTRLSPEHRLLVIKLADALAQADGRVKT